MSTPTSRRTAVLALVTVGLVAAALAAGSLDRPATAQAERPMSLELFLRRFYGIPSAVKLKLGAPRPGPVAGLEVVPVTVGEASRTQTIEVLRIADGRYVVLAPMIDLREDPFAAVASAIDVKDRPALGPAGAPVTVVEYSDFQCPFCRRMSPVTAETMQGPRGKEVRWVYKHFPLKGIHPWAEPAAVASECARQAGGNDAFWKLHDHYFSEQEAFTLENHRERVLAWARKERLPMARFEACLDAPQPRQLVNADLAEGQSIGVKSTPTLVVNGRVLAGFKSTEELGSIIEQELAYQRERRRVGGR